MQTKLVLEREVLIMSLSVADQGILTSHSDGTIAIWTHDLSLLTKFKVADMEVWIQCWSSDRNVVYAGSDDGLFSGWDVRDLSSASEPAPTFANRKTHSAGVTAIMPKGDQILTGSYDDHIRRFDRRNTQRPVQEVNLQGGVWRIVPKWSDELLVCCMYNGAKILHDDFSVIKEYDKHQSIVYGGDACDHKLATCSFYDKKVSVWR